ncbi:hypothetical protein RvY_12385 [Ramazzottius varieornatus]|uniref:BZIP domain-containing protein n=1 Tax=Ramazzottius varieornatus TaxID=947166 RepID=A0A1D1VS00_RAMVA|nr:hypothetical protein RvY_12385 [Ramazzottius varieornatus]
MHLTTMEMEVLKSGNSSLEVPESVHDIAEKKRKMTLDFAGDNNASSSTRKRRSVITSLPNVAPNSNDSASPDDDILHFLQPGNTAFLLTSPDINMLKISSPELERIIMNSWTPTSTPASFLSTLTHLPTSSSLTAKSENIMAEADVFAKFLNDLHSPTFYSLMASPSPSPGLSVSYGDPAVSTLPGPPNAAYAARDHSSTDTSLGYQHQLCLRTSSGSSSPHSGRSKSPGSRDRPPIPPIYDYVDYTTRLRRRPARGASLGRTYQERYGDGHLSASDGDQEGPCSPHSSLDSSDMSTSYTYDSIKYALRDVDEQFRLKSERKRERNRLAAAKCRKRKMDKIGTLGQQVDHMRSEVEHLEGAAAFLRRQIWHLKAELLTHLDHGCLIADVPSASASATSASNSET